MNQFARSKEAASSPTKESLERGNPDRQMPTRRAIFPPEATYKIPTDRFPPIPLPKP